MHLALLRGINVGGKNIIHMGELRQAFEDMGFVEVRTYIQSGNVLFRADRGNTKEITVRIERGLSDRFGYTARAVVKSKRQYLAALKSAPRSWGADPSRKHNALFAGPGLRGGSILAQLPPLREELEEVTCGPGVIFWSASIKSIARTTMTKIVGLPAYTQLTVRNHRTTLKLGQLLVEG
jgi:uncharacterized protein (DUF1697 family)